MGGIAGVNGKMRGFTLIELSIVLTIIGLLIGGVLVGQDMIKSANERAQITQIEKINQAVNTFRVKYNALPGDIDAADAATFGFAPRGQYAGEGDGNGLIEGVYISYLPNESCGGCVNESLMMWEDLTRANGMKLNMIDGIYYGYSGNPNGPILGTAIVPFFPPAKIGRGNYVNAYSGGVNVHDGSNYFVISEITAIGYWAVYANPGLMAREAYDIDKKLDDGFPQSGRVIAAYQNAVSGGPSSPVKWADGDHGPGDGTPTPPSPTTCYDDGGITGAVRLYSIGQNNGNGVNCALSFRFQ